MPSNVNVNLTNLRNTGTNVSVPQVAIDCAATWTKDNGQPGSDTRTLLFPNILNNAAIPQSWRDEVMQELMYRALRVIVGLDQP